MSLVLITGACSIQHRPKQQFAGPLVSSDAACPKLQSTLIVQRDEVVFAPDDGTWVLQGKAVGQIVQADRSRPGFDKKSYATSLKATISEARAIGTYTTPSCNYTVDLPRF